MSVDGDWTRDRFVRLVAWLIVAIVGLVTITQALGWTPTRGIAVVQSLTPYLGMTLMPVVLFGLWRSDRVMVTTGLSIGLTLLLLATPLAIPAEQSEPREGANGLSVAAVNLWYRNDRVDDVAVTLGRISADVIVFSEYTRDHQSILRSAEFAIDYPHRVERSRRAGGGTAVWSRYPLVVHAPLETTDDSFNLSVAGPDGLIRLLAIHVPPPINTLEGWKHDLSAAANFARTANGAAMVVGDLNATYWHPPFRDLLDAGLTDAHTSLGRGFSTSWPTNGMAPAFARLDHALVTAELVVIDVGDFDTPGSDHRGLLVTVAPAR